MRQAAWSNCATDHPGDTYIPLSFAVQIHPDRSLPESYTGVGEHGARGGGGECTWGAYQFSVLLLSSPTSFSTAATEVLALLSTPHRSSCKQRKAQSSNQRHAWHAPYTTLLYCTLGLPLDMLETAARGVDTRLRSCKPNTVSVMVSNIAYHSSAENGERIYGNAHMGLQGSGLWLKQSTQGTSCEPGTQCVAGGQSHIVEAHVLRRHTEPCTTHPQRRLPSKNPCQPQQLKQVVQDPRTVP